MAGLVVAAILLLVHDARAASLTLTPKDIELAAEIGQLIQQGAGDRIAQLITSNHISSAHVEDVLSAIFMLEAELKIEEAQRQVNQRRVAPVEIGTPEGVARKRIPVEQPAPAQLRETLRATQANIHEQTKRFFDNEERYRAARELVASHRATLDRVYDILQRQTPPEVHP